MTAAKPVYSAWFSTKKEKVWKRHDTLESICTATASPPVHRLENGRNYVTEWKLEQLPKFVNQLRPSDEVAVEMTGNTRLFHDAVAPHVKRVVAVNASQFQVITHSVKKTDPHDARNLALYLAKDLLPEVRMKDKARAQIASLTQTRDTLVKQRTRSRTRSTTFSRRRGSFSARNRWPARRTQSRSRAQFDVLVELELKILVQQIRSLNHSIAELEETIRRESQKLDGHKNLTSHQGDRRAQRRILLSIIGDIRDFSEEGKLAAYFGIVPRISNSNANRALWTHHQTRHQTGPNHLGPVCPDRTALQPVSENLLRKEEEEPRYREGHHRAGS